MATIEEVRDWLEGFVRSFNFELPGREGGTLGEDVVHKVAELIQIRSVTEQRGANAIWFANSPRYRDWKAMHYGVFDQVNTRTGQMLSHESLLGRPQITADQVLMTYGTGSPPARSAAPTGYLSDQDQAITDYEKAQFAHAQDRPFYEVDDEIERKTIEHVGEYLDRYILDHN